MRNGLAVTFGANADGDDADGADGGESGDGDTRGEGGLSDDAVVALDAGDWLQEMAPTEAHPTSTEAATTVRLTWRERSFTRPLPCNLVARAKTTRIVALRTRPPPRFWLGLAA